MKYNELTCRHGRASVLRLLALLFAAATLSSVCLWSAQAQVDGVESDSARTRAFAVRALGEQGGKEAIAPLVNALGDPNVFVRAAAIQALERLGAQDLRETVVAELLAALGDDMAERRAGAAETLGILGAKEAIEALTTLLDDTEPPVQNAAACALARLDATESVGALIALMTDDDAAPFGRMGAAWALGELGAPVAVEPLLGIVLGSPGGRWNYTSVPVYAAEALGKIDDRDSLPRLVEALDARDRHLRAQVAVTLERVTGQSFGENREDWEAFLASDS